MKIMGLDYGNARIGIAFSDLSEFLASPYSTLKRTTLENDLKYFKNLVDNFNVKKVVIGLPLEMSGNEGEISIQTKEFAKNLQEFCNVEIIFQDERLSSVEAEELLKETVKSWQKRKELLDQTAASIILQSYLDKKGD